MFGAQGALAALYRRGITGRGQVVNVIEPIILAVQESTIPDYDVGGVVRRPCGTRLEGIAVEHLPQRRRFLGGDRGQPGHRVRPAVPGDGPARAGHRRPVGHHSAAAATKTSSTRSSAPGPPARARRDHRNPGARRRDRQLRINTVAEVVDDPRLRARDMLVKHDEQGAARSGTRDRAGALRISGQCAQRRPGAARSTQRRRLHRVARQPAEELAELRAEEVL